MSLAQWVAFHLTNTKLAWPYWDYWSQEFTGTAGEEEVEEKDEDNVGKAFIRLVIEHCTLLSYPHAMKAALLAPLHTAIPNKDSNPPDFPLLNLSTSGSLASGPNAAVRLIVVDMRARLLNRIDMQELEDWLYSEHDGVDEDEQVYVLVCTSVWQYVFVM